MTNPTATEARLAALPDADLLREWQTTDGEPRNELADLIAGEIERRVLD